MSLLSITHVASVNNAWRFCQALLALPLLTSSLFIPSFPYLISLIADRWTSIRTAFAAFICRIPRR
jgi:hypothetical protein